MPKVMIGVFARRAPDGSFLPAQPIYRDVTEAAAQKIQENILSGITEHTIKHFYGCRIMPTQGTEEASHD